MRAGVAGNDRDEILPGVGLEIATRAGAGKVVIDLVGTACPLLGIAQGDIADKANALGQVDRPDKALAKAVLLKLLVGHEVEALAKEVLGLAIVKLMIAGDDGDNRIALDVDEGERLARAVLGELEELSDLLDGRETGGMDLLQGAVAGTLGNSDPGWKRPRRPQRSRKRRSTRAQPHRRRREP